MSTSKDMITCKHCGADVEASAAACPNCGKKAKTPFYQKPWLWVVVILVAVGAVAASLSVPKNNADDTVQMLSAAAPSAAETTQDAEDACHEILHTYSAKLRAATPDLIEEYKAEAESNTQGRSGLEEIRNAKIAKLAAISQEGVDKMAEIMLTNDSEPSKSYNIWTSKLAEVYLEESQKITDIYVSNGL